MSVIDDIRAGNKDAIKDVYKEHAKDVYNFAKSITGDHDSALDATKKTFVTLFTRIQNGETPTNIRLSALKIAYDEACRIAMPSTEILDSPYDPKETLETDGIIPAAEEAAVETAEEVEESVQETVEEVAAAEIVSEADEEPEATEEIAAAAEEAEEAPSEAPEEPAEEAPADDDDDDDLEIVDAAENETEKTAEAVDAEPAAAVSDTPEKKRVGKGALAILIILDIILILALLWFLGGLLVKLDILPESIGNILQYPWFNENVFPLF